MSHGWVAERQETPTAEDGILKVIQVVEDVSSCLGDTTLERAQHIARDHKGMCRFSGSDDSEFRKVNAALDRIQRQILDRHTESGSLRG